jgi:hypothetical protein
VTVDELAAEVVDRLRSARSLSWLRAIDAAVLDATAGEEPDADVVVAPYRWLLDRVGDGVKLTQAGYLPPTVVKAAMTELGWAEGWYGKNNREDVTLPVLELRESAQRFGLVRKYRGHLVRTRIGRTLADDPLGLWWHLASVLPDARSEPQRHAGVLYLITVAAGLAENDAMLAEGMTILGVDGARHLPAIGSICGVRRRTRHLGGVPTVRPPAGHSPTRGWRTDPGGASPRAGCATGTRTADCCCDARASAPGVRERAAASRVVA